MQELGWQRRVSRVQKSSKADGIHNDGKQMWQINYNPVIFVYEPRYEIKSSLYMLYKMFNHIANVPLNQYPQLSTINTTIEIPIDLN